MERQSIPASIMRANALHEIAVGMWYDRTGAVLPFSSIRVALDTREPVPGQAPLTFSVDTHRSPYEVARGESDLSFFNPSEYLTMAYRGVGPFSEPLPLRAIAVFPSWDRMGFTIAKSTGIDSFAAMRERRPRLRISVRASETDTTRFVIDQVLQTEGFSLKDIEAWGGSLHLAGTPGDRSRLAGIADGSIEAVFDEGIAPWMGTALEHGHIPLPVSTAAQQRLADIGWPICSIPKSWHSALTDDVPSIDFSGWPLFTHDRLSDDVAYRIVQALDLRRAHIPFDSQRPVELADLCNDSDFAPLAVPLHPGAERYYREHGALR